MNIFLRFIQKEFIHLARDMRSLVLVLGMPILLVIAFGFALTNELKDVKVDIAQHKSEEMIEELSQKIDASSMIEVRNTIPLSHLTDRDIRSGSIQAVLIFPPDMERSILLGLPYNIQLQIDASDPNSVVAISSEIQGIVFNFLQEKFSQREKPEFVPSWTISTQNVLLYNPEMKSSYYFVPGVMGLVLMIVCAMMTSVSIVREKEYGSMEILLTSPISPLTILLAKSIPYLLLSLCNVASILLVAHLMLGVPILGSLGLIFLTSLLFIGVSLLLGLLISSFTNDQMTAMLISGAGLLLPVALLSGMIFPIESMPTGLQVLSHIVPAKWYVTAMKKLMIQGVDFMEIYKEIAILASMIVVLVFIGLRSFKVKLK